jgi:hypothetical protein
MKKIQFISPGRPTDVAECVEVPNGVIATEN